jgi:hypothetical protein
VGRLPEEGEGNDRKQGRGCLIQIYNDERKGPKEKRVLEDTVTWPKCDYAIREFRRRPLSPGNQLGTVGLRAQAPLKPRGNKVGV